MDDERKDHPDPERPPQIYRLKQPSIHNVPTDNIENTNGTNKGGGIYYSLKSCRLFSKEHKGCCKWTRGTGGLLYIDLHILKENKIRQKYQVMACIDNKRTYDIVPQSCILHCLKVYRILDEVIEKNHGNPESKDPKRYIPRRCVITITICNSDDAAQSHSLEMHRQIET